MTVKVLIVYNLEEKKEAFEYTKDIANKAEIKTLNYRERCTNITYSIDYENADTWNCIPGCDVGQIKGRRADIIYYSARLPQDIINELYYCRRGLGIMIPVDFKMEKELNKR